MNCGKFFTLISAHIDGELPDQEKEKLVYHLNSCSKCGKILSDFLYLKKHFEKNKEIVLSEKFETRLMQKIRIEEFSFRRKILIPSLNWAAAACLLFIAAAGLVRSGRYTGGTNSAQILAVTLETDAESQQNFETELIDEYYSS